MRIQPECWDDADEVRALLIAAFPSSAEADLVQMLHEDGDCVISLVARDEGRIAGQVMLSRMRVEGEGRSYRALGLGPVSILPERQGQGIGSALIREALRRAEQMGEQLIFVLGDPDFYGRFGFSAETAVPFASSYAGPYFLSTAFGVPLPSAGTAEYAPAFGKLP